MSALVVFDGQAGLWWLRLLRSGFRHCFVAVEQDHGWVVVNPLSHRTEISVLPAWPKAVLSALYRQQGFIVTETQLNQPPLRCAPWRPHTCVEAVKRVLGLHDAWLLTPWQLYRHLNKT